MVGGNCLPEGDEVVVWKLDRLGRNTRNLLSLIDDLEHRDVHFRSVTEGITTTGSMGRAMLTVMSAFAQLERDSWPSEPKRAILRHRPGPWPWPWHGPERSWLCPEQL